MGERHFARAQVRGAATEQRRGGHGVVGRADWAGVDQPTVQEAGHVGRTIPSGFSFEEAPHGRVPAVRTEVA